MWDSKAGLFDTNADVTMFNNVVSFYRDTIIKVGRHPQKVNHLSKAGMVSRIDQV